MNKKNLRASALLLLIVVLYWIQGYFAPQPEKPQVLAKEIQTVVVNESVASDFSLPINVKSETKAFSKVDIRSQTSEKVVNIGFKDGDYVNEGEVICTLDSGERLANFKRAEIGFNSAKELSKKGLSSQSSLVAAETTFEQARIALERTNIAAPFRGFVDNLAKEGQLLQNGQICASLVSLSPLKIVGNVSELVVSKIKPGQPVKIKLISGEEFEAAVTFVASTADSQTRTFRVESELPNEQSSVKDGLTGEMTIFTDSQKAHFIPTSAFLLADNGDVALATVLNSVIKIYTVQILIDTVAGAWVTGLPEEANIVVAGQGFVKEGEEVNSVSR